MSAFKTTQSPFKVATMHASDTAKKQEKSKRAIKWCHTKIALAADKKLMTKQSESTNSKKNCNIWLK